MGNITYKWMQDELAKHNIKFSFEGSSDPLPNHFITNLTGLTGKYEVISHPVHMITSETLFSSHLNTLAERLWEVLKEHPICVKEKDRADGNLPTIYYWVKNGEFREKGNAE